MSRKDQKKPVSSSDLESEIDEDFSSESEEEITEKKKEKKIKVKKDIKNIASYDLRWLYDNNIKKNSNYLSTVEIETEEGKKFIIFQGIWKDHLTVSINPFTKQFISKFYFDIDGNGLSEKIFNFVNESLMCSGFDGGCYFTYKKIFMACDNNLRDGKITKLLIYLGVIKFIITHFNIKINYEIKNNIIEKNTLEDKNCSDFLNKDFMIYANGENFYIIKYVSRAFLKFMKWICKFLASNYTNYESCFLEKTLKIIDITGIDLCRGLISDTIIKPSQKCKGIKKEIKKSPQIFSSDKKMWKSELLTKMPCFGIINKFGVECQSVITELFPHKVAMFLNAFLTKGLKHVYLNIDQFGILSSYEQEERAIYKKLTCSTIPIGDLFQE